MSQHSDEFRWQIASVERYPAVDRNGQSCIHGKWRTAGHSFCGSLQQAIDFARRSHADAGTVRLTSPVFEIVALRDSFSVKRLEVAG